MLLRLAGWRIAVGLLVLAGLAERAEAAGPLFPFYELTKLSADAGDGIGFGEPHGVATSADGATVLVAGPSRNCVAGLQCGAVYVFIRSQGTWVQQARLMAPDPANQDLFGEVALSADGNTALVGVHSRACAAGGDCGAAYIFVRTGTAWNLEQKLMASDVAAFADFGVSVALSADGNTALLGALSAYCGTLQACGAAYVFQRSAGVWSQQQKIVGDPGYFAYFGWQVALSGDGGTALISGDRNGGPGSVYAFKRSGDLFSFQTKLSPSDSGLHELGFDLAVSANGGVALVEAVSFSLGRFVYVFVQSGTTWLEEARLFSGSSDPGDSFGRNFAISKNGETALVGAVGQSCSFESSCGAAYVFHRDQGAWNRTQQIAPSIRRALFGFSLALSGDGRFAAIGAPGIDCPSGGRCGAEYLFTNADPVAVGIPTLGDTGLAVLAFLLAVCGAFFLRR